MASFRTNTPIREQYANSNDAAEFPDILRGRRILLFSESLGPINGVSRTTTQLIRYLQAHGVDLKLVAPHYLGERSRPPPPIGPIRRLGGLPLPYSPELSVAFPFRLDRVCSKFKPDLVYLASPASVGFQVLLQIRCLANPPPVIANFQTDLSSYAEILFPAPLDRYGVWLLQVVQGYLFGSPSVQAIFYPSSPVHNYLTDAGVQKEKLIHLGRGVDTDLFSPSYRDETYRQQLAPNGEIILICVGRLAPEKGFGYLAQIAIRLGQLRLPFKLVIVGGNRNPAVEEEVRGFFAPVSDKVVFTGFLEGASLARAYASADIFLHCSVTETFGLVVLEAMACGIPVVARDAGGPSEIVRHETSGFLVDPEDLDQFVAKVMMLAENPPLRSGMASASRNIAEKTTWDRINNRVAWQLAHTLEQNESDSFRTDRYFRSSLLNWIYALGATIWVEAKLTGAMLLVSLFWVVAVLPIMIHGNIMFPRNSRQQQGQQSRSNRGAQVTLPISRVMVSRTATPVGGKRA